MGVLAFIGSFGPILQLPDWLYNVSPIEHVPRVPVASFDATPLLVLSVAASALVALGLFGLRRREIGAS